MFWGSSRASGGSEDVDGGVEDAVMLVVAGVEVDAHVGRHAKLGELALGVHNRARRETHAPAVGQLAGKGQAAAAASGVANDRDLRQ